jgi:hypothetical protein
MAGSKEDTETVTAFFEDMKRCGAANPESAKEFLRYQLDSYQKFRKMFLCAD